jgi:hypothetical protein
MIAKQITTILRDNPGLKALEITRKVSLDKPKVNADNYPTHVVNYWMNNSVRVAQKHYLQITDDHHLAGCGIAPELKAVSPAVTAASFMPIHAPSAKTQTLQMKAFPVIDHQGPSVAFCA